MVTFTDLENIADKAFAAGRSLLWQMHQSERACNFNEQMQCTACGHRARQATIENNPAYCKCVSAGFNLYGPGDGEPPEWETVCPACDARESFDVATVCAECLEYPCICTAEDCQEL